jgi:uncharacterized protein DUF6982/PilZ domain-containing protein
MFSSSTSHGAVVCLADRREMRQAQADRDRRVHTRHPAGELAWVNKARLKYGPKLSLVDLSSGGAQIEIDDFWLRPGSTVVVEIVGGATVFAVPSRVVRCQVSGITPSIRYRGALEFKHLVEFPDLSKHTTAIYHDPNPLHSHARLARALRRLDSPVTGDPRIVGLHAATGDESSTLGAGAMAAALAMLDTPAGRRAGAPFARELSALFSDVAHGVEQRESPQELTARVEQRLRCVIPAQSIHVTDGSSPERPHQGSDVVYFDAPSAHSPRARKILVEFESHASPQEWQFQLLKTSGYLVALIDEIEEHRRSADEAERIADDVQAGWSKLVVRYADGRLLKGYCQDFHPPRGHFQLWPSPTAPPESRVLVPIGHLKAVFVVHDFAGNSEYREDTTIERSGHGRKVTVTFLDDEVLVGNTLNYRPDGVGFFVTPSDPKSNNARIFVISRAVRHVQFG